MTPDLWVPGLIVLAAGAAAGWWFTRGAAKGGQRAPAERRAARVSLEVADLRRRRDELYAGLKDPKLSEEARIDLELQAAKVLKRLDEIPGGAQELETADARLDSPARPESAAPSPARTLVSGFVFGGGTVALIALLVFWAGRDAKPRPDAGGAMGEAPTMERPHPEGEIPPAIASEVEALVERIEAAPDDIGARKRLALLYLGSDQYVAAFEQAKQVLAVAPDDIDSLYVQGVVRMTMGQDDQAMAHLDRVLELFPEHVRAMTVRGLIFARRGQGDEARATWTRALEIGGPQPQIETLLAMLDSEGSGELPPGHPPTDGPAGGSAAAVPADAYTVRVEADVIAGFAQTGVLFVALRPSSGGPPVAVRRIDRPVFPMTITVGPGDMMMATGEAELPATGLLTVRLDQDGSASTRDEADLEGSAEMSRGDLVTLFLN